MIKFDPNQLQNWLNKPSSKGESNQSQRSHKAMPMTPSSIVDLGSKNADSFSFFHKSVQRKLEHAISFSNAHANKFEKLEQAILEKRQKRADASANNILGFIAKRLQLDKQDGATADELKSRIEAGLKGFEQGYEEASTILSDMGLMNDELSADIQLTADKVKEGLYQLANEYLGEDQDVISKPPASESVTDVEDSGGNAASSVSTDFYSYIQSQESRGFTFQLETQDGDKVSINASAFLGASVESGGGQFYSSGSSGGTSSVGQYNYTRSEVISQQQFSLNIEGDLDEDELEAINTLLEKINSLSADFYEGDFQKALSKALDLGYDSEEISGFALNLSQTTSVKAVQAYQPEQQILKPEVMNELKPLGKYASEVAQSLNESRKAFAQPQQLMNDLFQQMELLNGPDQSDLGISFSEFSASIIEKWTLRVQAMESADS